MLGLSANVSVLYRSLPFVERLTAAAEDGFECVEFWVAPDPEAASRELSSLGLQVSAINVDMGPGPSSAGLLSDPGQTKWWRDEFQKTLEFAGQIGCRAINVLAGGRDDLTESEQFETMHANLEWALAVAPSEITLLLEPLNRADRPQYLLHTVDDACRVRDALGDPPGLKILFDVYHLGHQERDVAQLLVRHFEQVGHVQVADVPGRGAPGTGAIDFGAFWEALAGGYDGWLGLEYSSESAELGWLPQAPALALRSPAV